MHTIKYEFIKAFLLGGKANFILRNKVNEHRINFTINSKEENNKDKETYFVHYKSHQDIYLGSIVKYPKWIDFYPNKKIHHKQTDIFAGLFYWIFKKNQYPNNIEILYTGECFVCGRKLTNPIYIEMGIGEKCLIKNKMMKNIQNP